MKKCALTVLILIAGPALSAEVPLSDITYIAPWISHIDIQLSAPAVDPQGCGSNSQYRIDLVNDAGAKAKLATVLSAFMAGKKVGLSIDGCLSGTPKIVGVRLYK